MNNLLTSTIGIDTEIQNIQTELYSGLSVIWGGELDSYGRVYRNVDNNARVKPEWFIEESDYKEVYYNDEFSCTFMFIDGEKHETEDEFVFKADVKCVFMVDLNKILPSKTYRADAKAQKDVVNLLRKISIGKFNISEIEKGIKNVFSGFDTSGITFDDKQPLHCFSVNIKLNYYIDECE